MSHGLISAGCRLVDPEIPAAVTGQTAVVTGQTAAANGRHCLLAGHEPQVLELLIAELGSIERTIVLNESLRRRLRGCEKLCSKVLRAAVHGALDEGEEEDDQEEEEEEGQGQGGGEMVMVGSLGGLGRPNKTKVKLGPAQKKAFASVVSQESRLALASLLCSNSPRSSEDGESYSDESDDEGNEEGKERGEDGKEIIRPSFMDEKDARLVLGGRGGRGAMMEQREERERRYRDLFARLLEPSWPLYAGQREWVYEVARLRRGVDGKLQEDQDGGVRSRMYLQHNQPGDIRLSLVLCSHE